MPTLFWQDLSGQTVFLNFDSTQGETHEDTVTITDHPVEDGVNITDHARNEPITYLVEGIISNIPMPGLDGVVTSSVDISARFGLDPGTQSIELDVKPPPTQFTPSGLVQSGIGAIKRALSGKPKGTFHGKPRFGRKNIKAQVSEYSGERNRPKEAYELLLDAKANKSLITVITPFREHSDLLIQRLAVPRSTAEGQSLKFQIDLRQIRIVTSETVTAPVPLEARGATKKNAGAQRQSDKDGSVEEEAQLESTLHSVLF